MKIPSLFGFGRNRVLVLFDEVCGHVRLAISTTLYQVSR